MDEEALPIAHNSRTGNTYVTYKQLVISGVALIALMLTAASGAYSIHQSQHLLEQQARNDRWETYLRNDVTNRDNVNQRLRSIEDKLDSVITDIYTFRGNSLGLGGSTKKE